MAKTKRARDEEETYDSDNGFVSNDDGKAPKSKKSKKATASKSSSSSSEQFWALSTGRNPRRVNVSEFKSAKLVNIREYYEKDDEYLPGKKGISLTIDQYKELLKAIPHINAILEIEGPEEAEEAEMKEEEEVKSKKVKPKPKANIEETSEEEE